MRKKLLLTVIMITSIFMLVACSGSEEESKPVYEMSDEYFDLSIEDYKKICDSVPYDQLFHEIDTNQGIRVKYVAKVDQVILESTEEPSEYVLQILDESGDADVLDLAETLEYESEDYAYAYFMHGEGVRLIAGDYIIIYGEPWGVEHVKDGNGVEIDLPKLHLANVQRFSE